MLNHHSHVPSCSACCPFLCLPPSSLTHSTPTPSHLGKNWRVDSCRQVCSLKCKKSYNEKVQAVHSNVLVVPVVGTRQPSFKCSLSWLNHFLLSFFIVDLTLTLLFEFLGLFRKKSFETHTHTGHPRSLVSTVALPLVRPLLQQTVQ